MNFLFWLVDNFLKRARTLNKTFIYYKLIFAAAAKPRKSRQGLF